MPTHTVYLPVAVTITDGVVTDIAVDYDGAPWMNVDSDDNVWSHDDDEWVVGYRWVTDDDGADTIVETNEVHDFAAFAIERAATSVIPELKP